MAYIFKMSELPSLVSAVPGRERILFVNQELAVSTTCWPASCTTRRVRRLHCICTRTASTSISSSTAMRRWSRTTEYGRSGPVT